MFTVGKQLDFILEMKLSDFAQRIYLKLLMYSYILIYLLCSSVLQWISLIVLILQNLSESENHQNTPNVLVISILNNCPIPPMGVESCIRSNSQF